MTKTAFKTFVYSFAFSLFVILMTNRLYLHTPEKNINNIKIPEKNITLFLKNNMVSPIHVVANPTKKIILSHVDDIQKKSPNEKHSILPEIIDIEKENILLSQNMPLNDNLSQLIPLEKIDTAGNSEKTNVTDVKKEKTPQKEVQIPIIASQDNDLSEKKVIYTPKLAFSLPDFSEEKKLDTSNTPSLETSENMHSKTDDSVKNISKPEAKKIVMAEKDISNDAPHNLIPLEASKNQLWAKAEIKNTEEIQANQVALNVKDTPISSMKTQKESSKLSGKKSKKDWNHMTDGDIVREYDDPWVVAKGRNFPNNQLLQDEKKYKISEEEIQKIFETPKTLTPENAEEVELASKTVKNILIPIPEDILNDENLTPQLISSPQNEAIKEEFEAKELLKKENEEENVAAKEENIQENSSPETKESGSILNSLTSLFGSEKNSTPEIGTIEDEDEQENSLLSAFTRKQNKLLSKILPVEIRLSFQPNRAEISGQTLKWIKAFAQKTAEEPTTGLEIRIDGTSSPLLQRRRLNLLQNILLNEGASPEKIRTVFTAREPNSFILRTIRINKEKINTPVKSNNRYMQW